MADNKEIVMLEVWLDLHYTKATRLAIGRFITKRTLQDHFKTWLDDENKT